MTEPKALLDGKEVDCKKGIMAGVPLSGFLANLYLKELDEYMVACIRYIATGKHTKSNYNLRYEYIKKWDIKIWLTCIIVIKEQILFKLLDMNLKENLFK